MPLNRRNPMKRTPFVIRTTPLSGGKLKRGAFVAKAAIKATRKKVTPEERAARKAVKTRSDGRCEGCATPEPTDYSHRVGVAQGGPWTASNAMALCRRCHTWLHSNLLRARQLGWYLRSFEDHRAIPVQHAWLGLVLLHDDGSTTTPNEEKRVA